ncbi:MAG: flagellar hook-length control protein FliK, partial [Devosia sp.]
ACNVMGEQPSREAFVSVTVGFSQATTPLLAGTTRPDGTPADGSADGIGEAGLFAALLAMLAPGAPAPDADAAAVPTTAATLPAPTAPATDPATTPDLPALTDLQQSEQGKALLRDFTTALKAARAALDAGQPLDPALEKKLEDTVAAIAAWFAGQPLLQPTPVDTGKLAELASGKAILPAAPGGELPAAPTPSDATPAAAPAAGTGEPVVESMQFRIVPARLGELGTALKDFAAQLERASPQLAKALAQLADRIGVGDISDDVLAQLGLNRTPGSTSPQLDQLVAALTARPDAKAALAPQPPIAPPTLALPEVLAGSSTAPSDSRKPPEPQAGQSEPLRRPADPGLDAEVKLEARPARSEPASPATDAKPAAAAHPDSKPAAPPTPPPAPVAAASEAPSQAAQAAAATAATATRAIHAAYAAPVQQLNLPQVAFEVARQFEAGNSRFQIRLDPPEMGRVDVRLDLDKHGSVNARLFVERPETLDLMLRDQRALQQALQQAGLDTSKTSLEFSLRQSPFGGAGTETGQGGSNGQPGFGGPGTPVADESTELPSQTLYRGSASASGVNLFV